MKKMKWKKSLTLTASAALALSLLVGCGAQPAEQSSTESKAVGTVLLSVNPEIEVEYDKSGLVLEIEGLNKDGKTVVKDVKNYQGKDCRTVVNELVREIYADGYFEKTVDGHTKNIVLKLEEGSVYVSDEFLQDVADGIRETVQECGIGAKAMTVSEGDLDDAGHIGQNKAKELVLAQLGLESASFRDHEYELDDGVYEFEFTAGGVEYEYEVDARTGKVLEADIDAGASLRRRHRHRQNRVIARRGRRFRGCGFAERFFCGNGQRRFFLRWQRFCFVRWNRLRIFLRGSFVQRLKKFRVFL